MKRERSSELGSPDISNGTVKTPRYSPEDSPKRPIPRRSTAVKSGAECPYLNTVSRQVQRPHALTFCRGPASSQSDACWYRTWTLTSRSFALCLSVLSTSMLAWSAASTTRYLLGAAPQLQTTEPAGTHAAVLRRDVVYTPMLSRMPWNMTIMCS